MSLVTPVLDAFPADWLRPDWPAPAHVQAVCTTRHGYEPAAAPWPSPRHDFNLGDHVGDEPARVTRHRAQLAAGLGARPVFLRQVHGTQVARLAAGLPDGVEADVAATTEHGLACTVMVADCLPILLTDRAGQVVAAAHAGWRGLLGLHGQGVVETALSAMREAGGRIGIGIGIDSGPDTWGASVLAWLGPCIGPQAFEVGDEVRAAFCAAHPAASAHFQPTAVAGKWLADLPALARQRLAAQGVTAIHGNDGSAAWCTVSQAERFFSYRRDQAALGGSGRQAACIWLRR